MFVDSLDTIGDCNCCLAVKEWCTIGLKVVILNSNQINVIFVDSIIQQCHGLSTILTTTSVIKVLADLLAATLVILQESGLTRKHALVIPINNPLQIACNNGLGAQAFGASTINDSSYY